MKRFAQRVLSQAFNIVEAKLQDCHAGPQADLADPMARHMDIDAVWSFGAAELAAVVEKGAASNIKRTWVNHGMARDWFGAEGAGRAFLQAATEVKNIWVPYGE